MSEDQNVKPSIFERHLQTGIQLILVALLGWAGLKLVSLGEDNAVLRERLIYQGDQISSLRRDLRDWSNLYYRKTDANREIGALQKDVQALKQRVIILEEHHP
ncbi:hypothetical protein SAMN05421509_10771 [Chromohalobacter canadensis]|uniref:Uncharacterized protein n=1 Tax=Chromohalobacter canadensis TaxID=141389 RepID=A0A285VR13_9GAMM|nr:hypothetical protein [Chromohalobacter canadensis]SOC56475.1 hypothetical protein SAMN05421509_10771 [Chromohalobacter canadensis]